MLSAVLNVSVLIDVFSDCVLIEEGGMDEIVLRVKLGSPVDPELDCKVVFDMLNGGNGPGEADDTGEAEPASVPAGVVAGDMVLVRDPETNVELAGKLDVEVKLPEAGTLISVAFAVFTLVGELLEVGTGSKDAFEKLVICPDSPEDDPVGTVDKLALENGVVEAAVIDDDDSAPEVRGPEEVPRVPVAPPWPEGPVGPSVKEVLLAGKGALLVGTGV